MQCKNCFTGPRRLLLQTKQLESNDPIGKIEQTRQQPQLCPGISVLSLITLITSL